MARGTQQTIKTIFSAQAATGTGVVHEVSSFRNVLLQIGTASSANLTLKIQGSFSDAAPDFSAAQSVANHWDYVGCYDLNSSALIPGSTGFVAAGTDLFANYMLNVEGMKYVCATVTARSAGSVTVKILVADNE
jgi:hypothetical protein